MLPTFTAPTNNQPEVPEYVRQAGVINGIHVYFVVYPIFRHGASGPVVAYQMNVSADGGYAWGPGNYLIFPTVIANTSQTGEAQPQAYISVVPDGVRSVRWHFTCKQAPAAIPCELPAQRVVTVPVHGNLATLPITSYSSALPTVNRVTWFRTDGSQSTFIDPTSAIPFLGAPPRRVK
jgi:hypothetical protein